MSQEECAKLREGAPYVKLYRYNSKHIYPKLNGYGDNGQKYLWNSSEANATKWFLHLRNQVEVTRASLRFRTVPEILQTVDRSIRTINTTGAAKGILRLPHRWQRVVRNDGDYFKGQKNFETYIYFVSVVNK